ncbi:MAG: hypothetical protein E8A12_06630 [Phenylobacterium sp.]|nr:MAG: hypothetical protein E8A12_06630 [Phenylobacterium sp.]
MEDDDGLASRRVDKFDLRRLGCAEFAIERLRFEEAPAIWRPDSFAPRQRSYLDCHRGEMFIA